jgi:hypothetical protein
MAAPWMEIEIEPAGDEIRVTARGSRNERMAPYSLGAAVTRKRLLAFAGGVERAVQTSAPLAQAGLEEAWALHEAVFHGNLRELTGRLLEAAKGRPLLQHLLIRDRDLQAIPWEALCPRGTKDYWGSSAKLLLARGVMSGSPWQPREVRGAVRLLAISPSSDERSLEPLRNGLSRSIEAGEVEWLEPIAGLKTSRRFFFDQLRGKAPHILHFLGHGGVDAQGCPILRLADDDDDEPVWINAEALAQELSASFGEDLRLIVLEACEGANPGALASAAEILAGAGAGAVVAHLWPVKTQAARDCSRAFYSALTGAAGTLGDVAASLGAARRTLLLASAEGFSPVVYLRGPSSTIFRFEGRSVPDLRFADTLESPQPPPRRHHDAPSQYRYLECDRGDAWGALCSASASAGRHVIVLCGKAGSAHSRFVQRVEMLAGGELSRPEQGPGADIKLLGRSIFRNPELDAKLAFVEALDTSHEKVEADLARMLQNRSLIVVYPTVEKKEDARWILHHYTEALPKMLDAMAPRPCHAFVAVQPILWKPTRLEWFGPLSGHRSAHRWLSPLLGVEDRKGARFLKGLQIWEAPLERITGAHTAPLITKHYAHNPERRRDALKEAAAREGSSADEIFDWLADELR